MDCKEKFITQTYQIARAAVVNGNHPFGALLVVGDTVIATAENTVTTENDCTCHAELNLLRQVQQLCTAAELRSSILYTSTEPCAMCAGAIFWSGIRKVVFGCSAGNLREIAGKTLSITAQEVYADASEVVQVIGPVLEAQGAQIHKEFW